MAGINQVFVLFMLIVVGYFIRKKHLVSDAFQKDMSNFVMKVTMPFFALMSVYTSMTPELFKESVVLVIIAFGLFGLGIVFSYGITKILKIEGMRRDVLQFTMVFPNVGFMGIPVMKAVYGNSGVIYSVFFVFTFNLLLFSFGVYLMKRHCDGCDKGTDGSFFRRFLRGIDPVLYALFAGLILMALKVRIPTLLEEMQVIHLAGYLDWESIDARAQTLPPEKAKRYQAFPYLHEMGAALAAADLIVSRSGASTLGEYPLFGLPAILIPYPYAWRYQKVNASYLEDRGAAIILKDEDLESKLLDQIRDLMNNPQRLKRMSRAMVSLATPFAAQKIAKMLAELSVETEKGVRA